VGKARRAYVRARLLIERAKEKARREAEIRCGAKPEKETVRGTASDIIGNGFTFDCDWLHQGLKAIKWSEKTALSFIASKYGITGDSLEDALRRLTWRQAEDFTSELNRKVESIQRQLP